jgi:putative lipoprotein
MKLFSNKLIRSFAILLPLMLLGCAIFPNEIGKIQGSLTYRERIALPAGAKLDIQLVDISIADAPAKVIAKQQIDITSQVPIPFVLDYPKRDIKEGLTYSVSARITHEGQLWFISDRVTPVLTRGRSDQAHLLLVKTRP